MAADHERILDAAPCCVVVGAVSEEEEEDSVGLENRLGAECSRFGRVLDAVSEAGGVAVYFASDAAAVACRNHLVFEGSSARTELRNVATVEIIVRLEASQESSELEREVGAACAAYGRVLDVKWEEGSARVAMATATGAAAAVVALDGTAFDGRPVEAGLAGSAAPPAAELRPRETKDDVEAAFAAECARYGTVRAARVVGEGLVVVEFEVSRAAAACAAAMSGREFDGAPIRAGFRVRGGGDLHDAGFAAAILDAAAPPDKTTKAADPREKLEKAVVALRAAARRDGRDEKARANLAGALLRLGRPAEALDEAQAAVDISPQWAWAHFRKGSALMALGDVAKAATSLALAAKLDPSNESFGKTADNARRAAAAALDPLDAYATEVDAEAAKDLADAAKTENLERETGRVASKRKKRPDEKDDDDDDGVLDYNPRAHCYICKQWGHSKKDCPLARCQYCHEIGHRKADCPLFTAALANAADEEKKAKRKVSYAKKKAKRKEEWTQHLREQTGIEGFAALYRVLGLPERRLATAAEIKKAYHRRSLEFHPDKHPDNIEEAHERFLEIKAAYELLVEGMETGGKGLGGAVFSAGELTDAAAAQALQEKVNTLAEKVSKSSAWAG